jgi:hypothetical protein
MTSRRKPPAKSDTTRKPTSHVTPLSSARKALPVVLTGTKISSTARSPRARHALAVDTHALETDEGMAAFQSFANKSFPF